MSLLVSYPPTQFLNSSIQITEPDRYIIKKKKFNFAKNENALFEKKKEFFLFQKEINQNKAEVPLSKIQKQDFLNNQKNYEVIYNQKKNLKKKDEKIKLKEEKFKNNYFFNHECPKLMPYIRHDNFNNNIIPVLPNILINRK